ncbi:hypothetical protein ACM55M_05465 [Flavobacterium sp. ZT3R25]|uniref:hypothetical protein n=1 Tax=Flavobacterium galactosi TaxID=3398735 RepID=UPI003A8A65C8
MRNIKNFLKPVLILVFTVAFLSCKNNKTEKTEPEEVKAMDTTSAVVVFEPFQVIVHKLTLVIILFSH